MKVEPVWEKGSRLEVFVGSWSGLGERETAGKGLCMELANIGRELSCWSKLAHGCMGLKQTTWSLLVMVQTGRFCM